MLGAVLWFCFLKSDINTTITGVILAFTIPFKSKDVNSLSNTVQYAIHKPVAYLILPLFALANTCIVIPTDWISALSNSNSMGIVCGLILSKPFEIILFSSISIALGFCSLPDGVKIK